MLSPLVVLRRVKAFHRSPSSPLSTETTSVNTSFPRSLSRVVNTGKEGKAHRGLAARERTHPTPCRPGVREGPEEAKFVQSGPVKSARTLGPLDRSLVMPRLNIRSAGRTTCLKRLALLMVQTQWASPLALGIPPGRGERARSSGRSDGGNFEGAEASPNPVTPWTSCVRAGSPSPSGETPRATLLSRFRMEARESGNYPAPSPSRTRGGEAESWERRDEP